MKKENSYFHAEAAQEWVVHINELESDERPFNDVKECDVLWKGNISSVFGDV